MFSYTARAILGQVCVLILLISLGTSSAGNSRTWPNSLLAPLPTSFTPFGPAVQLPPEAVVSLKDGWTINKRIQIFVNKSGFAIEHGGGSRATCSFGQVFFCLPQSVPCSRSPPGYAGDGLVAQPSTDN
jgi:hypothetical protein